VVDRGDEVDVVLHLTPAAARLPALLLNALRAVVRTPSGRILDRSGFRWDGATAAATFPGDLWTGSGPTWIEITSAPRDEQVVERVRDVERAMAAGRRAALFERLASGLPPSLRGDTRERAATSWDDASRLWFEAGDTERADAADDRAEACRAGVITAVPAFATERLAPALGYWLEGLDVAGLAPGEAAGVEGLARAIRSHQAHALAGLAVGDGDVDRLAEVAWAAAAGGDLALTARAAEAWSAAELAAEDEDDEEDL
jgi:hypothetical protein